MRVDAARQTQYPAHWEADVLLLDGGAARLRPIRPDDADRLVAFYSRVSPESKYKRFFAPYPSLSERDLERFTTVDHRNRVAFVVTLGPDIVGVGRYDKVDEAEAEVAFLVEDSQQGRGSPRCCSSTWLRRAGSAAWHGSSRRCCPTTPA